MDTGDPDQARISSGNLRQLKLADGPLVRTNFGWAQGGWVRLEMPEFGLQKVILVFAADPLVHEVQRISPDFEGQVGLEFLRQLEYGGNDQEFWVRKLPAPTSP